MDGAMCTSHRSEFANLLRQGEDKIASIMRGNSIHVPTGKTLIQAGTDHPYVYRLLTGWACRIRSLADGRSQFTQIFLPGDFLALENIFVASHTDSVRALSNLVAERVDRATLHRTYVQDSDVAMRCIWQVMEEERRLRTWIVSLGQGSADERLALLLMDLRGRLISAGVVPDNSLVYGMPLTQSQLASYLGITAVHVNRVLKEFRDSGIVTVREGHVRISKLELLTQRASPLFECYASQVTTGATRRLLESTGIPA